MRNLFFLLLFPCFLSSQVINPDATNLYINKTFTAASASGDAVNVNRYDTVYFIGCTFNGQLKGSGGSNMKVIGCNFNGIQPVGDEQWNRAADIYHPQSFYFQYNIVNSHTGGIRIDHRNENTNSIIIKNNKFYNIDARNGYGVYTGRPNQRAAILIDGCVGITGEISYNYFYNEPNISCGEDGVNLRNSGGTFNKSFPITHNYFKGQYSYPVSLDAIPSTSAVTVETGDEKEFNKVGQYVRIDSNYITDIFNGGINATSTHDVTATGNIIVNDGYLPNGDYSYAYWSAMAIWNGSSLSSDVWKNNSFKGNKIANVRKGSTNGGIDRNDVSTPETISLSDNYHFPNPITNDLENSLFPLWVADTLKAAGIISTPVINTTDSILILNVPDIYTILRFDSLGNEGDLKNVTYKTNNTAICTVTKDSTTIYNFKLNPLKIGSFILTVTFTNLADEIFSKDFVLNVVLGKPRVITVKIKKLK